MSEHEELKMFLVRLVNYVEVLADETATLMETVHFPHLTPEGQAGVQKRATALFEGAQDLHRAASKALEEMDR